MRLEPLLTVVLEDDHRADAIVVGKQEAERGDEQVEVAVLVEVDRLDVGGAATPAIVCSVNVPRGA